MLASCPAAGPWTMEENVNIIVLATKSDPPNFKAMPRVLKDKETQ